MSRKKPKKTTAPVTLSPKKYIQTKGRSLPIHECLINPDWQESGMATILISRQQPGGKLLGGVYLTDIFCLGLKNTLYFFNETPDDYEEELKDTFFSGQSYEPCDYVLAHNIIYGAIAYAQELGFGPNKDFAMSRFILEEDDESIELMELEFGKDGQPCYIIGPYDNVGLTIGKLKAAVGEGNFTVISPADDLYDEDDDDGYFDEEEEDDFADAEEVPGDIPLGMIPNLVLPAGVDPQNLQLINYDISFEPMHDERYIHYYEQLGDRMEKLYEQAAKEPKKAAPRLEELILQYPEFPVLQNYLAVAYMNSGREQEAEQLIEQSYQNFPDYLFARLNYARLCLENGNLDRVAEILDNKFEIKLLYPERDTFHFSEVINFYSVAGKYFFEKGEIDRAQTYLDMMKKIDPEHPMTRQLETTLMLQKLKKGIGKLFRR